MPGRRNNTARKQAAGSCHHAPPAPARGLQDEKKRTTKASEPATVVHKLQFHRESVCSVVFSPNGKVLASCSYDGEIVLCNSETGEELRRLQGHYGAVFSLAFSPDSTLLASGSSDYHVIVWNTKTGEQLWCLCGHHDKVFSVAFSPNGAEVVSGSEDYSVIAWDLKTGNQIRSHSCGSVVHALAFAPSGKTLVVGTAEGELFFINPSSGKELKKIKGHKEPVSSVAFSNDGMMLASSSDDKTVVLRDSQTGHEVRRLKDTPQVESVAFSPDGQVLACSGRKCSLGLWSTQTGQKLQELKGHTSTVWKVTFSPDGTKVASCDRGNAILVWNTGLTRKLLPLSVRQSNYACFSSSPFIPVDEMDQAIQLKQNSSGIIRPPVPARTVSFASASLVSKLNPSLHADVKCIKLDFQVASDERKTAQQIASSLTEMFPSRSSSSTTGGSNSAVKSILAPHTLILTCRNDLLVELLVREKVAGIARLVVEETEDMTKVARLLENVDLFEEVVFPVDSKQGSVKSIKELAKSFRKFSFELGDTKENYEEPPLQLAERIKKQAGPSKVIELDSFSEMITKGGVTSKTFPMYFRSSTWDRCWLIRRESMNLVGIMKQVLQEGNVDGEENTPADAMSPDPVPGERAVRLAKAFVETFPSSEVEVVIRREDVWPDFFEDFFFKHIEPQTGSSESVTEWKQSCWVLCELWQVASYLQIEVLLLFCRRAWAWMASKPDV